MTNSTNIVNTLENQSKVMKTETFWELDLAIFFKKALSIYIDLTISILGIFPMDITA